MTKFMVKVRLAYAKNVIKKTFLLFNFVCYRSPNIASIFSLKVKSGKLHSLKIAFSGIFGLNFDGKINLNIPYLIFTSLQRNFLA